MESVRQATMRMSVFHAYDARNQLPNLDTSGSARPDQLHTQSGWQRSLWSLKSLAAVA